VTLESSFDEDAAVFFLEMLIKIVIQNRFVEFAYFSGDGP